MGKKILVAYDSKHGSTREIAERIGQRLNQVGLPADTLPFKNVKKIKSYGAFVLGSAVYIGRWRKKAAKFLKANERLLAEKPVWIFSSGPTGKQSQVKLVQGWLFPKSLQPVADRIKPQDIALFHGELNLNKLNFIEKWIVGKVQAPIGDFRDWEMIDTWALNIASMLNEK